MLEGIQDHILFDPATKKIEYNASWKAWNKVVEQRFSRIRGKFMSMIFQEPVSSLSPYYMIKKQIKAVIDNSFEKKERFCQWEKALLLIKSVGLHAKDVLGKYPHELSGGQCQRVALVLALVGEPVLLIADEPVASLDIKTRNEIVFLIKQVVTERNMGLISISHDLSLISSVAEKVLVMDNGRSVEYGLKRMVFGGKSGRAPALERITNSAMKII